MARYFQALWRVAVLAVLGVIALELHGLRKSAGVAVQNIPDTAGIEERLDTIDGTLGDIQVLVDSMVK